MPHYIIIKRFYKYFTFGELADVACLIEKQINQ